MIAPSSKLPASWRLALCAMPLSWLWLVLINHLRVEWSVNPQYSYGWAVPFLCVLLLWRRIQQPAASNQYQATSNQQPATSNQQPATSIYLLFALCALLYAPTRLIQEANPDWRLVSWALALEVVGITLCVLPLALSSFQSLISGFRSQVSDVRSPLPAPVSTLPASSIEHPASDFSLPSALRPPSSAFHFQVSGLRFPVSSFTFPLIFFLVAVPWPSLLEMPLIQALTRLDVGVTTELMGWLGIPAIQHGNVIEVATGVVGIDDACSGIRSFQATLMISLFLGEWLRLTRGWRAVLVLAGFLFSLLFNLARLLLLVWVASRDGVAAASRWHDPAGVLILLGCFSGLWFLAQALAKKKAPPAPRSPLPVPVSPQPPSTIQHPASSIQLRPLVSGFLFHLSAFVFLSVWILFVEIGVEAWYRVREARLPAPVTWNIAWPANPTMKDVPLAHDARRILRFDAGQNRRWQADGCSWQAVFLRWNPGSVAARLTANHTPEVCLSCAGYRFTGQSGLQILKTRGLPLPFRFYQVGDTVPPAFIAYCLWEDRAERREFSTALLGWGNRLAPVLAGQRNSGQRSLEIAVTGVTDLAGAQAAVQKLLDEIIVPHAP